MSLNQIRYFVAAAEEGSLARAATRLHVSQPPLTRQLRSLEEEVGAPLFERSRRGMALLPAGRAFLVHALRVLSEIDVAVAAARLASPSAPAHQADGSRRSRRAARTSVTDV